MNKKHKLCLLVMNGINNPPTLRTYVPSSLSSAINAPTIESLNGTQRGNIANSQLSLVLYNIGKIIRFIIF